MKSLKFSSSFVTPSKVVCIGRNYVEHIKELHNETPDSMVVFNKPNSAISDTLFYFDDTTRFEAEICFLIQNKKIAAVGVGLDLTKAKIQNRMKEKGLPWERAKSFDNSAVLSEFISFNGDLSSLRLEFYLNDVLTQFANYDLMIYKPQQMLEEIESFMSLEDYDIIMSGTPKGVGNYHIGDAFLARVFSSDTLLVEARWIVEKSL